jgi:hypothetical protein
MASQVARAPAGGDGDRVVAGVSLRAAQPGQGARLAAPTTDITEQFRRFVRVRNRCEVFLRRASADDQDSRADLCIDRHHDALRRRTTFGIL